MTGHWSFHSIKEQLGDTAVAWKKQHRYWLVRHNKKQQQTSIWGQRLLPTLANILIFSENGNDLITHSKLEGSWKKTYYLVQHLKQKTNTAFFFFNLMFITGVSNFQVCYCYLLGQHCLIRCIAITLQGINHLALLRDWKNDMKNVSSDVTSIQHADFKAQQRWSNWLIQNCPMGKHASCFPATVYTEHNKCSPT